MTKYLWILIVFYCIYGDTNTIIDEKGYIMYCPCMGRFGNQADQFIGALAFANGLNRTLVLPPWITYPSSRPFTSLQIPFDKWFKVQPLKEYHKVITMEYFMEKFASRVWPAGKRIGFCYSFRDGKGCAMKEGNPFGPFWNHFDVEFDSYVEHPGLLWDSNSKEQWSERFSAKEFPVLAFPGAPGNFPSLNINQHLQKYIEFSNYISKEASNYIKHEMEGKAYLAIHLRNGADMTNVCKDVPETYSTLFCSKQCTDYTKDGILTKEMCHPSEKQIVKQVKKLIKESKVKALYVAADYDPMVNLFEKELKRLKITVHRRKGNIEEDDPIIDIALLSKADYFIGNCVSSFSAFVRRHRETRKKPIAFFNVDYPKVKHDEL